SFFVQDIDPWTWKPRTDKEGNPVYKAVPCALARHNTVRHWNELVVRRADQDPDYPIDRELVVPMAHNLYGRPVLKLTPAGHPLLKGGYAVLRTEHRGRGGSRTRDALIIGRVAGKSVVAWDKGMQLILPPDGEGFQPHKLHIDEGWNNIRARVDGLWGAGTQTSIHEVGADASGVIDALSALGITLYDVGPRDVMGIVRKALHAPLDEKNPVLSYLIEHGHLQPDTDSAVQGRHIRGLGQMLTTEAGNAIHQARKDLVHSMGGGPAGRESGGMPTISDILSGDLTPEALLKAFRQQSGKCPLAQFIVKSSTAQRLGLEIMDWGCWVLTQARKDLLLELAKSQADGLQLPPRKKADPEVLAEPLTDTLEGAGEEASDPDDGVNGAAEEPAAAESASTEPPKGDDVEGDGVAQSV
ncbi:MAG: hypothetical protein HQ488_03595, partial [Parcubacteria group bacterium]|nr:hypothetical protein [Parcubacteria group bacterium]